MKVTVVVPAHNEAKTIAACLNALAAQQTQYAVEVIVVDNASTDKTTEVAGCQRDKLQLNKLQLTILHEPQKGRGAARRRGFAAARTAIVLSTDADSEVPGDWVEELVNELVSHPQIVAVSGSSYITDGTRLANWSMRIGMPLSLWLYRRIIGHTMLTGANFAIRRSAYEKAGGFDADRNMLDDVDLSFRVARQGTIRYLSRPKVKTEGDVFGRGYLRGFWHYFRHFPLLLRKYGWRRLGRN